jgi:hypothetical protein
LYFRPALAVFVAAACSDPVAIRPLPVAIANQHAATHVGTPADVGDGLAHHGPHRSCATPEYRQFDFWLGHWNVSNPDRTPAGTNRINAELRGCVIEERWTDVTGFRGRSLNVYDSGTGRWHQTWVDQSGLNLRLDGTFSGGSMVLSGARGGLIDRITWTPTGPRDVRQHWETSSDGGATFETFFDGRYRREPRITPSDPASSTSCQTNPGYRDLDFWIGEWLVRVEDGPFVGRSSVGADLEGCLVEERFRGLAGFESRSFVSFGRAANRWFRMYVDAHGRRLQLSGSRTDAAPPVLIGSRTNPDGTTTTVRVTWLPLAGGDVRETIELSSDGGVTYPRVARLHYRRLR